MFLVTIEILLEELFNYKRSVFLNEDELKKFMEIKRPHYVLLTIESENSIKAEEFLDEYQQALAIASQMFDRHLKKCNEHFSIKEQVNA